MRRLVLEGELYSAYKRCGGASFGLVWEGETLRSVYDGDEVCVGRNGAGRRILYGPRTRKKKMHDGVMGKTSCGPVQSTVHVRTGWEERVGGTHESSRRARVYFGERPRPTWRQNPALWEMRLLELVYKYSTVPRTRLLVLV